MCQEVWANLGKPCRACTENWCSWYDQAEPTDEIGKVVTEVWKVKKCFDRAVDDDNFFSIESNNMTVDYDRANDVVEVNLKMDLEKSRKDLYFW